MATHFFFLINITTYKSNVSEPERMKRGTERRKALEGKKSEVRRGKKEDKSADR